MTLAIILLLVLFIMGAPIFAIMLGGAFLGAVHTARDGVMSELSGFVGEVARMGTGEFAQVLSTIPLFIFAGYIMAESRTADRMVRFARAVLGWLPGGLAVVTILACAIFTTFTGASGVTIVALGGLLMPSLLKEGYPERFSLGLIAGTGSVGLLFPPALPLFLYGAVYGVSDRLSGSGMSDFTTDRFIMAGIVPGVLLISILAAMAMFVAVWRKVPRSRFVLGECVRSVIVILPEISLPFLIIVALRYVGLSIPEIAALTVVYVVLIETFLYRDLQLRSLWRITRESMALAGAIFIIVFAASALTSYFVTAQVPTKLVAFLSEHVDSRWKFLLALNLFLILIGMMMDIFSAIFIVVPLITPIAKQYGIDPFHLGVIFLINLEIGYLTPPVGLNLFITSFKFQQPVMEVIRSTVPFLVAMIVALGLVTYIPALTVVPEAKRTGKLTDLVRMVRESRDALSSVQELALPDGTIMRFDECKDSDDRLNCEDLFSKVTVCRKQAGGVKGTECEAKAIADFVAITSDDWDDDDDDDDDSGDGASGGTDGEDSDENAAGEPVSE